MPNSIQRPWAILLSRFQDDANDPTRVTLSALYAQWVAKYGAAMVSTWIDPGAAQDSRTILQLYQQFFTPVGAGTFNSVSFWDTMSHGSIDVSGTRVFPCRLDITSAGALAMGLSGYQYQEAMFKKAKAALARQHSVNWKAFYAVAVSFQSPDYGDQGGVFDGGPGVFSEGYSQGWGIVDLNVHGSVRLREKRLVSRKDLGVESNLRETSRPCIIPQDFPGTRSWNSARWCTRLRPDLAIRNGRRRSGCSIRLW